MSYRIKKVAVLGSGVMGSGIACHFANVGLDVIMLDMPSEGPQRNAIAEKALAATLKTRPTPLYKKEYAKRIQIGNFEDDLSKLGDRDWIIEVVVERLDIKKSLFEKVEKYRRPRSLITSNTSGIPINHLADGRSEDFQKHFCGTHFFNPARYMPLLEIIPHSNIKQDVIDFFMHYGDVFLGKKTVLCKDTPAFIANRIGFFSGNKINELTDKYKLKIADVDKITGEAIGWPSTGSYRLLDLVGLDTSVKVTQGVVATCPNDEYVQTFKDKPMPKHTTFLLDNNWLGNKSGQGYYKKTDEKDENGKTIVLGLNLETLEYEKPEKRMLDVLGIAKKVEIMSKRLQDMVHAGDESAHFVKDYFAGLLSYAGCRLPEISDNIYSIDEAMKSGYAWSYGPFEFWDLFGLDLGLQMIKDCGNKIPAWVADMKSANITEFYKADNGIRYFYDIHSRQYQAIPAAATVLHLDTHRSKTPVYKNSECIVHDIGDQVLCLEFISKANAIGDGIGQGMLEALQIAENGDWRGIVVGNNAKNFTVGANLVAVGMLAMMGEWDKLNAMVDGFQQINMKMRYSTVPVVTATQGYCFGGGTEMLMHTDAAIVSAETYMGLVEVGVGLIPGGGGTKEFALRASDSFFEGDTQTPTMIDKLKVIATASVATSGYEGFDYGYLLNHRDTVVPGTHHALGLAKQKVIDLSENYTAPTPKMVKVLGRNGLGALYTAINEFYLGKYMSDHDVEISRKVAYVLCGGDLTSQQEVTEQYLLDIEREAFLALLGTTKTQERIQYMLTNNKPLRN
jgi:3-hydroxyacyl-CoA dehydrogenase